MDTSSKMENWGTKSGEHKIKIWKEKDKIENNFSAKSKGRRILGGIFHKFVIENLDILPHEF